MGLIAVLAGIAFGLALTLLTAFFATKDARFDRVAEWSFVAFAALAIPTIVTVAGRLPNGGPAAQVGTVVGVASVAVIGLGELGSTLRLIDFRRVAPLITVAFLGFLAWIGLTSALVISGGGLPANLGWLGLGTIVLGMTIVGWIVREPGVLRGDREPGRGQMAAFFVPMIGIVAWMAWLGLSL